MCSLEFEIHRPLYDWVVNNVSVPHKPRQIEFARLNLTYTVMSKRFLRSLVEGGLVDGWDDPRMPTLCGLRRRGYTPASIRDFCSRIGVAKSDSLVDIALLEHCVREDLNEIALRRVAVLDPIRVVVENYPEDKVEYFELPNNPKDENAGTRKVAFTKELYIDSSDFALEPPPKFFRLKPDGEVRLMGSYIVKYKSCKTDETGKVTEITVTADLESGCGNPVDGRKIKGTIHWVSATESIETDVYLYNRLFTIENTGAIPEDKTYDDYINPESEVKLTGCRVEKALAEAQPGEKFQFVRTGYFAKDTKRNAFLRIVELKDSKKF
jgi:glutaminyl-tRNA synthetase